MYSGRIGTRLLGSQARERKWIFKWENKKNGSTGNVLTDQDGEEEHLKQPVVFTGRPKIGAGKARGVFNGPLWRTGWVWRLCKCWVLPGCPGLWAAWFPTWTVGWKVAHSWINKAKFVSRRWFCSKIWRSEPTRIKLTRDTCWRAIQFSPSPSSRGSPHSPQMCDHPRSLAKGWLCGRGEERPKGPRELCCENQPHKLTVEQRTLHAIAFNVFLFFGFF